MDVSHVRRRLKAAIDGARTRTQQRREQIAEAERAYASFLDTIAVPLVRQIANALRTEGYAFTVFTPAHAVRLASDRSRDDYIELFLDTAADPPQVASRVSHTRGSRTVEAERPVKDQAPPDQVSEDDLLEFLLSALEPWLER